MESSLIIKRAELRIRQQIFGGVVMFVTALMIVNSFGFIKAATDVNANVTFNITAGSFSLDNATTRVSFASQTFGVGNNITGDTSPAAGNNVNVQVTDYRGSGTDWSVSINANNLKAGTNDIPANKLTIYQDFRGFLTNIENMTTSRVALGSNGTLNDTGRTLINGSTQASGIVQFDNGFINLLSLPSYAAGDYGAKVFFTLT